MRKTVIIIFAVGLLGALSYGQHQNSKSQGLVPSNQNVSTGSGGMTGNMPSSGMQSHMAGSYKDGTYSGAAENNPYGTVQIAVIVSGGKIVDISFMQMPQGDGHTNEVTAAAEPLLKQTTLQAQNASIDFVSGATSTSESYQMSLQSALDQAVKA